MRTIKAFAIAALLATSAGAAMASPFQVDSSIQTLDNARYATVLTATPSEARSLAIDVDTAALQQQIKNNPALVRTIVDQGFQIEQIIGLDANGVEGASVTLYAL